jgi:hypothetical protein
MRVKGKSDKQLCLVIELMIRKVYSNQFCSSGILSETNIAVAIVLRILIRGLNPFPQELRFHNPTLSLAYMPISWLWVCYVCLSVSQGEG